MPPGSTQLALRAPSGWATRSRQVPAAPLRLRNVVPFNHHSCRARAYPTASLGQPLDRVRTGSRNPGIGKTFAAACSPRRPESTTAASLMPPLSGLRRAGPSAFAEGPRCWQMNERWQRVSAGCGPDRRGVLCATWPCRRAVLACGPVAPPAARLGCGGAEFKGRCSPAGPPQPCAGAFGPGTYWFPRRTPELCGSHHRTGGRFAAAHAPGQHICEPASPPCCRRGQLAARRSAGGGLSGIGPDQLPCLAPVRSRGCVPPALLCTCAARGCQTARVRSPAQGKRRSSKVGIQASQRRRQRFLSAGQRRSLCLPLPLDLPRCSTASAQLPPTRQSLTAGVQSLQPRLEPKPISKSAVQVASSWITLPNRCSTPDRSGSCRLGLCSGFWCADQRLPALSSTDCHRLPETIAHHGPTGENSTSRRRNARLCTYVIGFSPAHGLGKLAACKPTSLKLAARSGRDLATSPRWTPRLKGKEGSVRGRWKERWW